MLKLPFALKDGNLVEILQVERGLACNCFCPSCGCALIARKGQNKTYHFAHYNSDECKGCLETALHLAAKEILSRHKSMWVPSVLAFFGKNRSDFELQKERLIEFESVLLEKRIDNIVPDLIIEFEGKQIIIEIAVTHRVDDEKLKKIKKLNISVIEIDLSKFDKQLTFENFKNSLRSSLDQKKWLFHLQVDALQKAIAKYSRRVYVITSGGLNQIFDCPLPEKKFNDTSYGFLYSECFVCKYYNGHHRNSHTSELHINCNGRVWNQLEGILAKNY